MLGTTLADNERATKSGFPGVIVRKYDAVMIFASEGSQLQFRNLVKSRLPCAGARLRNVSSLRILIGDFLDIDLFAFEQRHKRLIKLLVGVCELLDAVRAIVSMISRME